VERLVTQLQATRAQDSPLEAQIADRLDRLAVLTGRAPGDLDAELNPPAPVPLPPEKVAVGDPAALLKRRPDVRAAERAIKQKTALIGQRTADLFPKVTTLLSSNAFSYAAAPILQWSPLDFGRTRARIDEAKGERDEALGQYRKTVLGALRDAETALETYGRQRDELKSLDAVQASADRAARLTTLRAQGGTATILDELQAESSRVNAQSNASQARAQLTEDFISLQKSLGLGWSAE
jgi:outer membrane protein TolC